MRFDLLNVVGSSPARRASPEADRPARAARRSMADHTCAWVSMGIPAGAASRGLGLRLDNRNLLPAGSRAGAGLALRKPRLCRRCISRRSWCVQTRHAPCTRRDGADIASRAGLEGAQVATIYKICGRHRGGPPHPPARFAAATADAATVSFISPRPRSSRRPRRNISPKHPIWSWSRSTPTRSAPSLKWEPSRGGDLFPHLYGAAATDGGALGAAAPPTRSTAGALFPELVP